MADAAHDTSDGTAVNVSGRVIALPERVEVHRVCIADAVRRSRVHADRGGPWNVPCSLGIDQSAGTHYYAADE
jgi:hypothetical protein